MADFTQDGHKGSTDTGTINKEVPPTVTPPTSSLKLPLAQYRYGREEMLLFHSDRVPYPSSISNIPVIVRQDYVTPIAITPLSPEEQLVYSGSVNSSTSYSIRGRGGYYSGRGRGGRGRGGVGRPDYYRTLSGGGEDKERGFYRSNSESHWNEEGRGGGPTSRATQDKDWRASSTSTSSQPRESGDVSRNKQWTNNNTTKLGGAKKPWQPLPDWATDDGSNGGGTNRPSVGGFDDKGRYTEVERHEGGDVNDDNDEGRDEEGDGDDTEDVFTDEVINIETSNNHKTEQERITEEKIEIIPIKGNSSTSADSLEEMEKRFEKAAESILSTEDEDTPSSSPHPTHTILQQPNMSNQWMYQDPQKEVQGPFSDQDMYSWFSAGYFQLDLLVRRSCDMIMLPLGDIIRIWGRLPFTPGPHPPPITPSEPFWQTLFQNRQDLSLSQAPPSTPPQPLYSKAIEQVASRPVWDVVNKPTNTKEDQWPDLGGGENNVLLPAVTVAKQQPQTTDKILMSARLKKENDEMMLARQQEAMRIKEEEEEMRRKMAEEQQRKREEEERKRREDELRREEEKRQRLEEEERKRREEEERQRKEDEMIKKKLELERLEQQKLKRDEKRKDNLWGEPMSIPTSLAAGLSLLQIQKEEAARELVREQEMQAFLIQQQQQQQQQTRAPVGWNSAPSPVIEKSPLSFLEIQQEQEKQKAIKGFPSRTAVPVAKLPVAPPTNMSWSSKVASGGSGPVPPTNQSWSHPLLQQPSPQPSLGHTASPWNNITMVTPVGRGTKGKGRGRDTVNTAVKPGGAVKQSKEEDKVRQIFSPSSPDEVFTEWCANELVKYNSDIDAATFVSLLLQVESTYEVHDYIKSFLGESDEVHSFAKEFLERRQKLKIFNTSQPHHQQKKVNNNNNTVNVAENNSSGPGPSRNSKKKKKANKMQKMSPSDLLGFTVNAAERPNAGEIHSIKDAL